MEKENVENVRDKKRDILCIWKEFPYLGDIRQLDSLKIFAPYPIYETEIKLMAQMRIMLMAEYKYKLTKPYLESIKDNDDAIYKFVLDATNHYLENVKPKYKKEKLENFTESINFVTRENQLNSKETKIYNKDERA